ncbi:uncharacterized protein HMPREF1541_00268 [Cyphellophora europaea CBS 101466]|uniref:Apple domain-containing protein n=1 Tax=Cyphellophora europaea (strain CBS 101466) TaxID=1220924 RepID=W2SDU9_CYPE1|nr:uncharacterized protein HMPREF1541_00268 [Cyphellophora europaea CBS 101466]ETN46084.1 hypothetical protein HMPREF1541_00268 [Cyphellophora europaea CBS 101466]
MKPCNLLSGLLALVNACLVVGRPSNSGCTRLQDGSGPVPIPDTAKSFQNSSLFSTFAVQARAPEGWMQMYSNLSSITGTNTTGYLGFSLLESYDTSLCSARCLKKKNCIGINVYFERAPTVMPGLACSNPASTTLIKCAYFASVVKKDTAINSGYKEKDFDIVYAGSNA